RWLRRIAYIQHDHTAEVCRHESKLVGHNDAQRIERVSISAKACGMSWIGDVNNDQSTRSSGHIRHVSGDVETLGARRHAVIPNPHRVCRVTDVQDHEAWKKRGSRGTGRQVRVRTLD